MGAHKTEIDRDEQKKLIIVSAITHPCRCPFGGRGERLLRCECGSVLHWLRARNRVSREGCMLPVDTRKGSGLRGDASCVTPQSTHSSISSVLCLGAP